MLIKSLVLVLLVTIVLITNVKTVSSTNLSKGETLQIRQRLTFDERDQGRGKKKKGNKGGSTTNVNLHLDDDDDDDHHHHESYEVVEYVSSGKKGKKGGKRGKRKGHKKEQKGYKKYMKKMTPIALCILALKMLMQHFLIKKIAVLSLLSFLLSKTSFILSSLLAVKQMFHSNHHEKSDKGGKLEIVHIPIRKKHPEFHHEFHDRDAAKTPNYIPVNSGSFGDFEDSQSSIDFLNQPEEIYHNPYPEFDTRENFLEP